MLSCFSFSTTRAPETPLLGAPATTCGRSLLSCLESDEALRAPYSRTVAKLAFVLHRQGLDLAQIRDYLKAGVPVHEQARSR